MAVRMERLRRFVPVPQVAVHAVKAVQADTRQSIGQWKVLQVLIDLVVGQEAPPKAPGVTTERLRCLVPVAQVAEHGVKADQLDTLQSTAHWKLLQVADALKDGQPWPPNLAAVTTERVLVFEPLPHDLEQVP